MATRASKPNGRKVNKTVSLLCERARSLFPSSRFIFLEIATDRESRRQRAPEMRAPSASDRTRRSWKIHLCSAAPYCSARVCARNRSRWRPAPQRNRAMACESKIGARPERLERGEGSRPGRKRHIWGGQFWFQRARRCESARRARHWRWQLRS